MTRPQELAREAWGLADGEPETADVATTQRAIEKAVAEVLGEVRNSLNIYRINDPRLLYEMRKLNERWLRKP